MDFCLWALVFGLRSSGFGLRSSGFGLQSLVSRLGTPYFVVLFEYRSGHSNDRYCEVLILFYDKVTAIENSFAEGSIYIRVEQPCIQFIRAF